MTDIALDKITSGYNLSKINKNFEKVEDVINDEVLHREGGNNVMKQDLDLNGYALLNLKTNVNEPGSLLTVEDGDKRYVNVSGDKMEGDLDLDSHRLKGLPVPLADNEAVRKKELDTEQSSRISADQNLQAQLSETDPLEASAFSEISWHDQVIRNSVVVPPGKNAWSFGPSMTIAEGQEVLVSDGSSWTIADGDEYEGPLDQATYVKKVDFQTEIDKLVAKGALSASDGASLVGFSRTGSNVVLTVQQELLDRAVTPQQYGGTGNAAINAASASGKPVYFPSGTYTLTDTGTFTTDQTWVTDGKVVFVANFPQGSAAKPVFDFRAKVKSFGDFTVDHQANTKAYTVPTVYQGNPIAGSAVMVQGDWSTISGWTVVNAWDNGLSAIKLNTTTGLEVAGSPKYGSFLNINTMNCGIGEHGGLTPGKIGAGIDIGSASAWTVDDCIDYMSYIGFILDTGAGAQCSFNNCVAFYTKLDSNNVTNGSGYGFYSGSSESQFSNCISIGAGFRGFWLDAVGTDFSNCTVYIPQKEGVFIKAGQMRLDFRIKGAGQAAANTYDAVLIDSSAVGINSLLLDLHTTGSNHRYGVNATGANTIDAHVSGYVTGTTGKVNRQSYNIGTYIKDVAVGGGKRHAFNKDNAGMEMDLSGRFRASADRALVSYLTQVLGDSADNGQVFVEAFTTPSKRMAMGYDEVNDCFVMQAIHAGVGKKPLLLNPSGGSVMAGTGSFSEPFRLGTYRLWVDSSGRLRIKSTAPTSDTDGTIVGTQA